MSNRAGVMVRRWATALLVAGMGFAGSAYGAILLVDGTGELTGATGVDVGGALYDVVFRDGPCSGNFSDCDSATDFTFQSSADAQAASSSLLSQVFLGEFDSNPERTFGCSNLLFCETRTPYDTFLFSGVQAVVVWVARNQFAPPIGVDIDSIFPTVVNAQIEFDPEHVVWADWTLSQPPPVRAVPEPVTLALLAFGLAGLGFSRRRHYGACATLRAGRGTERNAAESKYEIVHIYFEAKYHVGLDEVGRRGNGVEASSAPRRRVSCNAQR